MKKILLICNAGMSSSLLVLNMQKYAEKENLDLEIKSVPISEGEMIMNEWDIVMLGPQIRYKLNTLIKKGGNKIPVQLIDMRDYGLMDGESVVKAALVALK